MISDADALKLAQREDLGNMMKEASEQRDQGFRNVISYSRKVFLPLTQLCRDVCHYCTFAQTPRHIAQPFMSLDQVLKVALQGAEQGCKEALFTLGERPELRYRVAREALEELGFKTTLEYLAYVAKEVHQQTGLLPHINAGCMSEEEFELLRPVSASMGIMLESSAIRLTEKGMPHYGSPDKMPAERLRTIERAGQSNVAFTSGILIGIGETRKERIESLLELRRLHERHGHLQEIIVQNFRAKPNTLMSVAPEPDLNELLWTISVTRLIFGSQMSIQAPPNLSPGVLAQLIEAGINDWGGVSPVTPDFVNPEAPWPHLDKLAKETAATGKFLHERLTLYPPFIVNSERWLDVKMRGDIVKKVDAEGWPKCDDWITGHEASVLPEYEVKQVNTTSTKGLQVSSAVKDIISKVRLQATLQESEVVRLFQARGDDFTYVCQQANDLRKDVCGEEVSYVVTRNINYTNVCYFKCKFCAFSKGKLSENLRGRPYDLSDEEISRRVQEAWQRGATEVCMQGGIHPAYTGDKYLALCRLVKTAVPNIHLHAFSPLEVWQGAKTLGISVEEFLLQLKDVGLDSLPGTAAEILDDEVRKIICPDKITSVQWLQVMEAAHKVGLRSTATIMFGHVDKLEHWARHLLQVRKLQMKTGGFTEFVPLPFVASEAPLYLRGTARKGPSFRESILMHAVSRLVFHGHIKNIQASWVKLGHEGVQLCLDAGANDLGGTLMNETITRSAGATHGQETASAEMKNIIVGAGRQARMRSTLYADVSDERQQTALFSKELIKVHNTPATKYAR